MHIVQLMIVYYYMMYIGQYSPVMAQKKPHSTTTAIENGRRIYTQPSSTSLLEVPPARHHHHGVGGVVVVVGSSYHSMSSSPSPTSSPPTSPSLTPSTPRSPRSPYPHHDTVYSYTKMPLPDVIYTDDSENDSYDGEHLLQSGRGLLSGSQSPVSTTSKDSISDMDRMQSVSPKGLRPPPQVVPAHSLPDLLLGHKSTESSEDGSDGPSRYTHTHTHHFHY